MDNQIRRIRAEEWCALRSLRLRALAETPTAFGSTLTKEQAYCEEVWRERAKSTSSGCDRATFIAESENGWVGMATGLANCGAPLLVAMYVSADARRQGIGVALVEAVSSWTLNCGGDKLALRVTSDNHPAIALYQRCAFSFTGATQPHPNFDGLTEQEMVRCLRSEENYSR